MLVVQEHAGSVHLETATPVVTGEPCSVAVQLRRSMLVVQEHAGSVHLETAAPVATGEPCSASVQLRKFTLDV